MNKARGWDKWCVVILRTMPSRPTPIASVHSGMTLWPSGGVRYDVKVKKMAQPGAGSSASVPSSFLCRVSCIPGRNDAFSPNTQGGSRVPESGPLGSVRGALSNECPYRDPRPLLAGHGPEIAASKQSFMACGKLAQMFDKLGSAGQE